MVGFLCFLERFLADSKLLNFTIFNGMNLQTDIPQIGLRPLQKRDIPDLIQHADNPHISGNLRDSFPYPYTENDAMEYIEKQVTLGVQNLAITKEDKLIGIMGYIPQADVYRLTAEIGYWVSEDYWNKGITTAAIKVFVPWVFGQSDMVRLYANVFDFNPASKRVLEKVGFTFEGISRNAVVKGDVIYDEYRYAILKTNVDGD